MSTIQPAKAILVDARNINHYLPILKNNAKTNGGLFGFDIETSQRLAHDGIKKLIKMGDDYYTKGDKVLFDYKRTTITGCSLYFGMSDPFNSYYLNFKHADVENRLPISIMFDLLNLTKQSNSKSIIHNRQYEYSTLLGSHDYRIPEGYCSMQLCVTAYNPDTYPKHKLSNAVSKALSKEVHKIEKLFANVGSNLNFEQEELVRKFCSKSGGSEFSYEGGIVPSISYGYGLKKAVKSWFNYSMIEFKDALLQEPDMEGLTGEEVVAYGCDDAFWCYHLFLHIWSWLELNNPKVLQTYIDIENPIVDAFAECTVSGISVNLDEIKRVRAVKRIEFSEALVNMKQTLRDTLNLSVSPPFNEKLAKYDKWYTEKSHNKYFNLLRGWLAEPDDCFPYDLCTQIKCATGNAWYEETTGKTIKASAKLMSINHYMAMRYILFVEYGMSFTMAQGKVQSDGEARSKLPKHPILDSYKLIGDIEQGMKLYNTPYIYLTDPETERMHPQMSSMLATRRTASQNPNAQQLQKRGESVYVRGYYQADKPDHLIISADWSAVELVRIAAASKDPEFIKAYGQRPHADLHSSAAAGVLHMELEDFLKLPDKKDKRSVLGKGCNFEYWYSGLLMQTMDKAGWSMDEMWSAVNGYRDKFPTGERWRIGLINKANRNGKVQLPDHHIRYKYECTDEWARVMFDTFASFGSEALNNFARVVIKKIRNRSGNQIVNADVQGTCAALAKERILKLNKVIKEKGLDARFMLLIHDELVTSVHKDQAFEFIKIIYDVMIEDSIYFPDVKLDSSVAIGYNFMPFSNKGYGLYGQIELHEMNKDLACIDKSRWEKKATDGEILDIINYLTNREVIS